MTEGSIFLAGKSWLPICAIGLAVALALILWSYVRAAPASRPLRFACALLKIVGTIILLACLLEPMWSGQRARPGANILAIIADNSLSMKLRGEKASESRGDELRKLLSADTALWRQKLAQEFQVRNYLADARLTATNDFSELNFDGKSSALGDALRGVRLLRAAGLFAATRKLRTTNSELRTNSVEGPDASRAQRGRPVQAFVVRTS